MFSTALVERIRVAPLCSVIELTVMLFVKSTRAFEAVKESMTTAVDRMV